MLEVGSQFWEHPRERGQEGPAGLPLASAGSSIWSRFPPSFQPQLCGPPGFASKVVSMAMVVGSGTPALRVGCALLPRGGRIKVVTSFRGQPLALEKLGERGFT